MGNQFDGSGLGILVTEIRDGMSVIVDVNDEEIRTNGFSREELIGKAARDCFATPQTNQDAITRAVEKAKLGKNAHFVARIKKKDGTPYSIRCLVSGERNANGEMYRFYFASMVIDDDDPALEVYGDPSIMAKAEKMTNTGSWRYSKKHKELVATANFYNIFGMQTGKDPEQQINGILSNENLARLKVLNKQCFHRGTPYSLDYKYIDANGHERVGTIIGEPEWSDSGTVVAISGVVRDMTSMAKLQNEYEMVLEAAEIGSLRIDELEGTITLSAEAAVIIGKAREEVSISKDEWRSRIHPHDLESAMENYFNSQRGMPTNGRCYRFLHESGDWHWIEVRSKTRCNESGMPTVTLATLLDVDDRIQAEKRLENSQQRFQDVLQQTNEAIFELDTTGKLTYVSDHGPLLFGYSKNELVGLPVSRLYADQDQNDQNWRERQESQGAVHVERVMIKKDNSKIHVQINSIPLFNESDKLIGYRGAARDITPHVTFQNKLEASQSRLLDVINTANGCAYETDANGYFTYLSDTSIKVFGYEPGELLGKPTYELSFDKPEDHAQWVKGLHKAGGFADEEQRLRKKDGSINHWLRVTSSAIRNEQGTITGFRGVVFDISERKKESLKLLESQQRLKEVVRATGGWTFDLDEEGRFTYISSNLDSIGGQKRSDLIGQYTWVLARHLRPNHKFWLQMVQENKDGFAAEMQLGDEPCEDANWLEVYCIARFDEDGNCFGFRGVAFDITDKKRVGSEIMKAKEAAENAAEERSRFLSTMSHEIRTPLNAVIGMTDLLLDTEQAPEQLKLTKSANTSGKHLLNLVNDILDFSKLDANKVTLEAVPFSIVSELQNVEDILRTSAGEKGIGFKIHTSSELNEAYEGDPSRIRQILLNLAGNAIKFTEKGEVSILASPSALGVRYEVKDSGIGIPSKAQASLFEDFSQADKSTTRKFGGTGLGLAICKRLVEVMKGEIGVESEPGNGSVFWFDLPLKATSIEEETTAPKSKAIPASGQLPSFRILVAEDNPANQMLMKTLLGRLGQDLTIVENGELAVEAAAVNRYDLIFMDMQMPVLDGYGASKKIRKTGNQVPIIALTANVLDGEEDRYRNAGMNDWMSKPFSVADLIKRIIQWGQYQPEPEELTALKGKTGS